MIRPGGMNPLEKYRASHTHPVNRATHMIGIPMIVVSLPIFFFNFRLAAVLFVVGWILQFIGHAFEGKAPVFFSDPKALIIGPLWWLKKLLPRDRR